MGAGTPDGSRRDDAAPVLRRALLAVLVLGSIGTLAELWLIGHFEDRWQLAPLVQLGAVAAAGALVAFRPGRGTLRTFQAVLGACVVSGPLGQYWHYRGNAEFELEVFPNMEGLELFGEAMSGATPVLAPGTMTVIGLVGLIYTWRHPALNPPQSTSSERTTTSP